MNPSQDLIDFIWVEVNWNDDGSATNENVHSYAVQLLQTKSKDELNDLYGYDGEWLDQLWGIIENHG